MAVRRGKSRYTLALLDEEGSPTDLTWAFPSVTEILDAVVAKPKLMHWYYVKALEGFGELLRRYGGKTPADFESLKSLMSTEKLSPYAARDTAADKGKDIHKDLERLALGKKVTPRPENQGLLNWWEDKNLSPSDVLAVERKLISFRYGYGGTVDLIYKSPATGRIVLTDMKTGTYVHWTHFVQGEAYRQAWVEEGNPPPDEVTVLHVRPELPRGYEEKVARELTLDVFLAIKTIYDWLPNDWMPEDYEDA
jgi:hypothetical protein